MVRYIIEARQDESHPWDSDYVGTSSLTRDEATTYIAELRQRAETDPEPDEQGDPPALTEDGYSWRGWSFRLLAEDEDGAYRPIEG